MRKHEIGIGRRHPPGATLVDGGVNFSVFSRSATSVELLLYETAESPRPYQTIWLDARIHRTFFSWHVHVAGAGPGTWYTWRVDGPDDTVRTGHRFDRRRELVDPWARAVSDARWDRRDAIEDPGGGSAIRGVVVDDAYDWEGDRPLEIPLEQTILYEMHVGGFTRHPSADVPHPGTFAAVAEKIPYLVDLGITHVELLPVMAFDEQDTPRSVAALKLRNYWGYSTHSFWSPHPGYCVTPLEGTHWREFRDMVKALHRAGIGVVLDVVFNHTAEGGADGPTISFKGLGNDVFYHLDPNDRRVYRDYSGCGNAVNCNHPVVATSLIECLETWVRSGHVDGFRFDLASVLTRSEGGAPMRNAPVVWGIELSDVLANTPIIAEAWDAGGLYQVGAFPGYRWSEWNGRYRDVVRRFVRGDRGLVSEMATRIAGSSDLYGRPGRMPTNGVNYVTCHDGFTLNDLVSYERKRNDANGEGGRDGTNASYSSNGGVEGETDDPEILAVRRTRARNLVAILLLSQGVPLLQAGDEVLRSQGGNNNAWCQDNPVGWFDWRLVETNADMLRFVRETIALRRRHPSLQRRRFLTGSPIRSGRLPDIAWHGRSPDASPWEDSDSAFLAFTLGAKSADEEDLHVILNIEGEPADVELPRLYGRRWHRAMDTARVSPEDVVRPEDQIAVGPGPMRVAAGSVVVFESR